ncbi:MAG: hypothetical protein BWY07_02010 [Candidatus Hydrogenedentes bacterium ADurb.Bin170]|nr:MAG: hypothetical protein BWY07_02010 [Candidatus Hydrogenedentes bacterium ADurb.Bin170]
MPRKITLRSIQIKSNAEILKARPGQNLDYRVELLQLISLFPDGITIDEMKQYERMHKILRDSTARYLILDESEYTLLLSRLRSATFKFYADELLRFVADIEKAEQIEAATAEAKAPASA